MNPVDNYRFAWYMNYQFGSEIYSDINGILYVKFLNNLFDENGRIDLFKIYEPQLNKLSEESLLNLENYRPPFGTYDWKKENKIIDDFQNLIRESSRNKIFKITNSSFIKKIQGEKINLVLYNNQPKVLLIDSEFSIPNSTPDIIENLHVTLSKLRLTPFVHEHGQVEIYGNKYLYLITDYVPLRLKDIQPIPIKNELLKQALVIAYAIHGMGYCFQDLNDRNFLYDKVNNKVYGIDFSEIMLCPTNVGKLMGTFYLSDLDRRVTFDEITIGVY